MDITDPDIGTHPESFQIVLDKATLDSLVCCEGDQKKVEMMLVNVYRMLAPGGYFICVSRGAPDIRLGYLQNKQLKWSIETIKVHKTVSGPSKEVFDRIDLDPFYYVYICEKKL